MTFRLLFLSLFTYSATAATPLWDLVENARRDGGQLVDLTPADQHRARQFFHQVFVEAEQGVVSIQTRADASALGLHIRIEEDRILVWGRDASMGLYVIRTGAAQSAVLQAPHSFYDLGTGALTSTLFEDGPWRAAFFNTTHRYGGPGLAEEERPAALPDLAHRPYSLFQSATFGALDALNDPIVAQIHGFRSREGEAAVLTSGAAQQPSRHQVSVQGSLRELLQEWGPVVNASARPDLAGRKNVQGRALSGNAIFLHLELSKSVRDGLLQDREQLAAVGSALLENHQ